MGRSEGMTQLIINNLWVKVLTLIGQKDCRSKGVTKFMGAETRLA